MIVIPKENPLITDLNSYYLNIGRLFEHFQGVVDSGCIYFKSPSAEGAVYFDEDNLINAVFRNRTRIVRGKKAIDILMDETGTNNFSVSIYEIIPERITFWANIADADDLHKDLSTEFTDLEGLIKKKISEKLTGYIEASFNEKDKAVLFLLYGEIIGASSAENKWNLVRTEEFQQLLIDKSREMGAIFNVRTIPLQMIIENYAPSLHVEPVKKESKKENAAADQEAESLNIIPMLQHLMRIYEKFIMGNKKIREDFDTILKRKFIDKVDDYDFLDPFVAEFHYSQGKITYTGKTNLNQMAKGLLQCLDEIADENHMKKWLKKHLGPWEEKYAKELRAINNKA